MVKEETGNKWTPRSKAMVLQQEELERRREELLRRIDGQKKEIADFEKKRDGYAEQTLTGVGFASEWLDRCLEDLRNAEEKLDVWENQLDRVEKQIENCQPTAEEAAEREKNQNALAALAEERLATDQQIHKQLGQLASLLKKRRGVTGSMKEEVRTLKMGVDEIAVNSGNYFDLDQDRFDALLNSLPANVLAASQAWVDWFLGRQVGEVRAVARERVERRETIAQTEIYNLGDAIQLSQAEFDELHRTDRPANDPYALWKCKPPRVFSLEEYESARAEAEEKGVTLEEIVVWQDVRTFHQDKERYQASHDAAAAADVRARQGQ